MRKFIFQKTKMLRAEVIGVSALPENRPIPTFEAWEWAVTPRTGVVVTNYPIQQVSVARAHTCNNHKIFPGHMTSRS
jgi:hypothetical protein